MKKLFILLLILVATVACKQESVEECDCTQYELQAKGDLTICHKGQTLVIDSVSWAEHQAHGDTMGECNTLSTEDLEYDPCRQWCLDK